MSCEEPVDVSRWKFAAAIVMIAAILVGLCVMRRGRHGWPVTTWAMYRDPVAEYAAARDPGVELWMVTRDKKRMRVDPQDVYPYDLRHKFVRAINQAFLSEDDLLRKEAEQWLRTVVPSCMPEQEFEFAELWEMAWKIEEMKVPPLVRDDPTNRHLLGRITMPANQQVGRGPS